MEISVEQQLRFVQGKWPRWHTPKGNALSAHSTRFTSSTQIDGPHASTLPNFYRYSPLDNGQIRVLFIEESKNLSDPIHCTLQHGPLHWDGEFQPYMTLSYAWGESKADGSHLTEQIFCGEKIVAVSPNLDAALRSIRARLNTITHDLFAIPPQGYMTTHVPIWVDAICINQTDTTEKNSQVRRMAEIYSSSSRLIIWLGDRDIFLDSLSRNSGVTKKDVVPKNLELCGSPWFTRRWVIQKYGLTPRHYRFFLFSTALFDLDYFIRNHFSYVPEWIIKDDKFGPSDIRDSLLSNLYSSARILGTSYTHFFHCPTGLKRLLRLILTTNKAQKNAILEWLVVLHVLKTRR